MHSEAEYTLSVVSSVLLDVHVDVHIAAGCSHFIRPSGQSAVAPLSLFAPRPLNQMMLASGLIAFVR